MTKFKFARAWDCPKAWDRSMNFKPKTIPEKWRSIETKLQLLRWLDGYFYFMQQHPSAEEISKYEQYLKEQHEEEPKK